jgi:hypothetical protein
MLDKEELHDLDTLPNIVKTVKCMMGRQRVEYKFFVQKCLGQRPLGRRRSGL